MTAAVLLKKGGGMRICQVRSDALKVVTSRICGFLSLVVSNKRRISWNLEGLALHQKFKRRSSGFIVLLSLMGFSLNSVGQNFPTVHDEYSRALTVQSDTTRLDPDKMFGDSVGLYTGSLEFLQTDASLAGNNNLEVAIKRTKRMGERPASAGFPRASGWDLAIPNMHGVFSTARGWSTSKGTDPSKRCSNYWWPFSESVDGTGYDYPTTPKKTFFPEEFWFGVSLYIPDSGNEAVLRANTYAEENIGWPRPNNGSDYPLRTKSGAVIRCVPSQDGTGEGFEVLMPNGISYRLDHIVSRAMVPVLKYDYVTNGAGTFRLQWVLNRAEYFLLVTSVRDRYGNTVTYEWDQSDPWKLNRIFSSDGRSLEITSSGGIVSQVRAGDRIWTYTNNKVIYPDQSYWEFTSLDLSANSYDEGSIPGNHSFCYTPGSPTTKKMHAVMRHPSGAVATFDAVPTLHGRSKTINSCNTSYQPNSSTWEESSETYPATYYLWSITSKSISGPGISAPSTWTYTYGPANGCYENANPSGKNTCTNSSPATKWVDVKAPDNSVTRYTYGNVFNFNEGYLLQIKNSLRTVDQEYEPAGSGSYPPMFGIGVAPPRSMQGSELSVMPLRRRTVTQDGFQYDWKVNSFDGVARPASVTKSSIPIP